VATYLLAFLAIEWGGRRTGTVYASSVMGGSYGYGFLETPFAAPVTVEGCVPDACIHARKTEF